MTSNAPISQGNLMPASGRGNSLELALEVSELRYRRLFETAQDGILILDADSGKIIDVNPFLLDLLDYPFESVIGLQLWEIGLFEDIAANQAAFEKLQTEEYIRYENHPLRTKGGKQIQVEFVSNVYFVGSAKVIQCNIRDISVRAEFQAASKSHADTLELAGRARDEVIAVLSHELRTPLGAISSMIDVLELGHGEVGMPDKKDLPPLFDKSALAFIRRNVQNLVRLVTELVDSTHVANGALALKLVQMDAHEVIRFALKNLHNQQKAAGIGIDLRLEAPRSYIRADADKLEQVLSNLIGNALKFTPKGGKVSIVTRNEESGRLVIEVSDTGIGIPADALSRIFSPFEQGDSSIHPPLWRSRSFDCAYFNESAWRHSGSGERGIRSRREVYRAFQNRRFAFRSHLPKILFRSKVTSPLARRPASLRPPTRQTPNCNPMELTITQNGALYAVQHRPAQDIGEICRNEWAQT
jgi:PAS domain S-box-containing protein